MALVSHSKTVSLSAARGDGAAALPLAAVFIDFDGTISTRDVTDLLLEQFAPPQWEELESAWLDGKIGARECMAKQIGLMRATPAELRAALDTVEIDPQFKPFIRLLEQSRTPAAIVSDGLDYSIHHILRAHGLDNLAVFSNQLRYGGGKSWQLAFPYKNTACPAGHCKCRRFDTVAHNGAQSGAKAGLTVYIGDGASDFCPAAKADIVFAKGRLAEYCRERRISHFEAENFAAVLRLWPDLAGLYAEQEARAGRRRAAS